MVKTRRNQPNATQAINVAILSPTGGSRTAAPPPPQSKRKQSKPQKMPPATAKTLQEIQFLQNSTSLLIPKAPFARLVREIMCNCSTVVDRITEEALKAFHESSEHFLIQLFEDAYACTFHRQQVTLKPRDIRLVVFLKNPNWYDMLG